MGIREAVPALADIIGVPQYFITDTVLEDVGDGVVRIAGCILRNGIYIPQYYSVMSCNTIIRCASKNVTAAQSLIGELERHPLRH